jgi:hypothetical protein
MNTNDEAQKDLYLKFSSEITQVIERFAEQLSANGIGHSLIRLGVNVLCVSAPQPEMVIEHIQSAIDAGTKDHNYAKKREST